MDQIASAASAAELTPHERELIGKLADVIVPGANGSPSATEVSVHLRWIDRGLAIRPELRDRLISAASACESTPATEVVGQLLMAEPDVIADLVDFIVTCYFMSPKTRKAIGYRGQVATPILEDETEYYLRDDLLAPVIGRGAIWRRPADAQTATQ